MDRAGLYAAPLFVGVILLFGLCRRAPVFDAFTAGAKEGLRSCVSLLPTLVGLVMGVSMLSASGALELAASLLAPAARAIGLPEEVIPLALMKPISGSGATALLSEIFHSQGADSFAGRVASVLAGSTETTLYCVAVYFGAVGIGKKNHALPAALTGDLAACLCAGWTVRLFLGGGA